VIIDTLQQIAVYLSELPGRKNILWFSGGSTLYLRDDAELYDSSAAWRTLYDELERERIAVYPIDARGLTLYSGRNTLHLGNCAFIWIARSIPERSGIITSDMSRSGASDRAAANASRGQVKNLAEKPLFCSMAARVDALTCSSSTKKMRES
jgi:hypothetical protein